MCFNVSLNHGVWRPVYTLCDTAMLMHTTEIQSKMMTKAVCINYMYKPIPLKYFQNQFKCKANPRRILDTVRVTLPITETLYHRDDALLCIAYVVLIWAALIPADRWHCSLWP